ncbi:phospholipase D family protein [Dyella telluris]|uniref:Phospholipase D family protein n=1 Tax=Dyella telluris TaxID=2763498 RepID=A0A7G8Q2S6_9GAMM|nr:phospholipase D family protein [Dyella telluris]QNK01084.1 phospholipase D family protein [Dyella telluris]
MACTLLRRLACLALLALAGCTHSDFRPDYPRVASTVLPVPADAPLAAYATRVTAGHGSDSGLRLISDSNDALLARIALANRAVHSLDLQYYMFHSDATGGLLAQRLLAAADRGVRVRLLLDDLHVAGKDKLLRVLDGHRNIEIRLFNPFLERNASMWGMGKQFAGDFSRLNRRMHNKAMIADGAMAVVGGRNIGDEYFDASEGVNFRDLDVLTVGPVVAQIGQMFDRYWNSEQSYPIGAFHHDTPGPEKLEELRKDMDAHARQFSQGSYAHSLVARVGDLAHEVPGTEWAWGPTTYLADDPDKSNPQADSAGLNMAPQIRAWMDGAQHRLTLISPYFVPGPKGVAYLQGMRERGVAVDVLTNSLASTDAGNVYVAYASYRVALLKSGVQLFELKPDAGRGRHGSHFFGSSSGGNSLHAKAIVVDEEHAFVGSMNLDPRSVHLNTEDGVIVDSHALAQALLAIFADATKPNHAYQVLLDDKDRVYWQGKEPGQPMVRYDTAPQTSWWRRFKVNAGGLLPIESLL